MVSKYKLGAAAALLAAACYTPAHAAVVSFNFTATIWDGLQTDDDGLGSSQVYSSDFSGHTISLGDHIVGSFSFDAGRATPAMPQPADASAMRRYYNLPGFTLRYTIVPSGATFADNGAPASAWVENGTPHFGPDIFSATATAAHLGGMQRASGLTWFDNSGRALPDVSMPSSLNPGQFDRRDLFGSWQRDSDGHAYSFIASMDTLVAAPVPEPHQAAMLLAGLGALAWLARRRRPG